jgi:3-hydroxyisobutyrate dehydrogenase
MTMIAPPQHIAFLGLGMMGAPMAQNLCKAGFAVTGYDRDSDAAHKALSDAGGTVAETAAHACAKAAAVITMLPNGAIVRDVLSDPAVIAAMTANRAVAIDMSSSAPSGTVTLGQHLKAAGLAMIDAPVSGGVTKAISGDLAILAGGNAADIAAVTPVLSAMGSAVIPVGALGAGHAMKALNNYVSAAGLTAACEAINIGNAFGLDPAIMVDALNASTGRNNSTENKMKQFVLSESFAAGFALELMVKDLKIGLQLGHELGVSAPLFDECVALWSDALTALPKGADHTATQRYLATRPD